MVLKINTCQLQQTPFASANVPTSSQPIRRCCIYWMWWTWGSTNSRFLRDPLTEISWLSATMKCWRRNCTSATESTAPDCLRSSQADTRCPASHTTLILMSSRKSKHLMKWHSYAKLKHLHDIFFAFVFFSFHDSTSSYAIMIFIMMYSVVLAPSHVVVACHMYVHVNTWHHYFAALLRTQIGHVAW